MFSPIKLKSRSLVSDLRQMSISFVPKSYQTRMKRRRMVRFDNKIITHQLPPNNLPSASCVSSNKYLERNIKECYLLRSEETAMTYLKECEKIKKKLRRHENAQIDSAEAIDASAAKICSKRSADSHLEKYISEILLEALRLSNYRGLESGSYSKRSARTPTVVRSVVDHYHQVKRRYNFLNKSKISEEVSVFAHSQTLPDQHWARVLAIVDERIVEI